MAHHPAADPALPPQMNAEAGGHPAASFLGVRLAPLLEQAWLHLQEEDFLTLQGEAAHLASCARVLGHGFLAEVAGMLALAASNREVERCELFLAVMRREWQQDLSG